MKPSSSKNTKAMKAMKAMKNMKKISKKVTAATDVAAAGTDSGAGLYPPAGGKPLPLNVYVVHSGALLERKDNIMNVVRMLSSDPRLAVRSNVVLEQDPQDIDMQDIRNIVSLAKLPEGDALAAKWNPHLRNMHINQVSNALKHLACLKRIAAEGSSDALHLVLEDDVCYANDLCERILRVTQGLQAGHEITFLGLPGQPTDKPGIRSVSDTFPILPSCESYVVSPLAAKRLVEGFAPLRFCTNKQFSYACDRAGVQALYSVPNVFADGSKLGRFVSTLETNNRMVFSHDWVQAFQLLQRPDARADELLACDSSLASCEIRGHPDILFLRAMINVRVGRYEDAQKLFATADQLYIENHAITGGDSEFLRAYTNNFKHLQE
jgi:hypothetical protein